MKSSKFTFKTQYDGDLVKFSVNFDFPLSKQERKQFKSLFLGKRDLTKEKLTRYHRALERFISNRREFTSLLSKSEADYNRLPFRDESEIQNDPQKAGSFNKNLKRDFINNQWGDYDLFFADNPRFREIISKIVQSHSEQESSIENGEFHDYLLKDDLLYLIRDKKRLIKSIKEKETRFRKELTEKIRGWKKTQAFLPFVFKNCDIVADNSTIEIVLNIKKLYENIFTYFVKYNGFQRLDSCLEYQLEESIVIGEDKSLVIDIFDPFHIFEFNSILEERNSELLRYCEVPFTYMKIKEKDLFKFHFEEVIKEICREFSSKQEIWRTPIKKPTTRPLKEKVLQGVKITIPIIVIIIIVFVSTSLFLNVPTVKVEKYDAVKIDYTVWVSDEDENYDVLEPVADQVLWVTMIPITENDSTGLMLGLYNNLLEKQINFDSGLVWLNRCIDENRDGIDDISGLPALTYGNGTDQYFNTCLMMKFKILDIDKYATPDIFDPEKNALIYILGYVAVFIGGLLLIIAAVIYGNRYIQKRRLKPKLFSRRFLLFKYGVIAVLVPTIAVITISIINVVTPFSEILFSNEYNPFILPAVIGFIVSLCVLSIPIYFALFGIVYRKIQKKRKTAT